MDKTNFIGVLQVALWSYEGLSELEIRQLVADLVNSDVIKSGIQLSKYLQSIKSVHENKT